MASESGRSKSEIGDVDPPQKDATYRRRLPRVMGLVRTAIQRALQEESVDELLGDGLRPELPETPEEEERRTILERLWRVAILAFFDDDDRTQLAEGNNDVLLSEKVKKKSRFIYGDPPKVSQNEISIDPIMWTNDMDQPQIIRIDGAFTDPTGRSVELQKMRITLNKDDLDEATVIGPDNEVMELKPTAALMVMSKVRRLSGVSPGQLIAWDPFTNRGE